MVQRINKNQTQGAMHCFLFDPSVYISMLASIEGNVTAQEIKTAVQQAYTKNETTMSKVILEGENAYFQNLSKTGCKVFIDSRNWQEIMHESEQETFRIDEGELVRSYIIPEKDGCSVFVMAHHIMGDGKALIMLLEDILCHMEGKEVQFRPLNKDGVEKLPPGAALKPGTERGIGALNAMWEKNAKIFTWDDYYMVHEKFWSAKQSQLRVETIEKEELDAIKAACKESDITVNSYIVTKMLREHPEFDNFCCPVSIRGENRSIANCVTLVRMAYKYNPRKSFEKNAKKVHKRIRRYLENNQKKYFIGLSLCSIAPSLLDSALMYTHGGYQNRLSEKVAKLFGYAGDNKTHLSVTNLQNLDFEASGERFAVRNVVITAACMSATERVACVSTFRDTMTISYCNITNRCQDKGREHINH